MTEHKLLSGNGLGLAWYSHAGHVAQAVELHVDAKKRIKIVRIVVVLDVGPIIDMNGSEAQAQGASTDRDLIGTIGGQHDL